MNCFTSSCRFRNYLKKKAARKARHHEQVEGGDPGSDVTHQGEGNNDTRAVEIHNTLNSPRGFSNNSSNSSSSKAHFFGIGKNEASYMPVLAIMARSMQQQQQQKQDDARRQDQHNEMSTGNSSYSTTLLKQRAPLIPPFQAFPDQLSQSHSMLSANTSARAVSMESEQSFLRGRALSHVPYLDYLVTQKISKVSSSSLSAPPVPESRPQSFLVALEPDQPHLHQRELKTMIKVVYHKFYLAMSQVDFESSYIEHMQNLYREEEEEDSGTTTSLTKEELFGHIFKVARQFRAFAMMLDSFRCLSRHDQLVLLSRNTSVFFVYLMLRCLGAKSGEEQLEWILGVNQPQNLSGKTLRKMELAEFNAKVQMLDQALLERHGAAIDSMATSVCDTHLLLEHTCLVAQLLLFRSDLSMDLENHAKVQTKFIESLEQLRDACRVDNIEVQVELLLKMGENLQAFLHIFTSMLDWNLGASKGEVVIPATNLPFLNIPIPRTQAEEEWLRQELHWFCQAGSACQVPKELANRFISLGMDSEVLGGISISTVLPQITGLLWQRAIKILHLHPVLSGVVERNSSGSPASPETSGVASTCAKLLLVGLASGRSLLDQMRALAGTIGEEEDGGAFCGRDLTGLGPVVLLADPTSPLGSQAALRHLADRVMSLIGSDAPSFKLLLSAVLIQCSSAIVATPEHHCPQLEHAQKETLQLLRRRLELRDVDIEGEGIRDRVQDLGLEVSRIRELCEAATLNSEDGEDPKEELE